MAMRRQRAEPLYETVKRQLLAAITQGRWRIGDKLPSEDELLKQYAPLSRGTIRRALDELVLEGYIGRHPGKGTFVLRTSPRLERAVGEVASFSQMLLHSGIEPSTDVLAKRLIRAGDAGPHVQQGFGVAADAGVIEIIRLRKGDQRPFSLQTVYLLPDRCPGVLDEPLDASLFRLYADRYGVAIRSAEEWLAIAPASDEDARVLQVAPGSPLVLRDRISYDQDGAPFEAFHTIERGDLFQYRYVIVTDRTTSQPSPRERGQRRLV